MSHAPARSLVIVLGGGRTATSLLTRLLEALGYRDPATVERAGREQPDELAAWHARKLAAAKLLPVDARPSAWSGSLRADTDTVADELRAFLEPALDDGCHLVVGDAGLTWLVPVWDRVAADMAVPVTYLIVLRHPAAAPTAAGDEAEPLGLTGGAAAWTNSMLFVERATRGRRRAFVLYDDLLSDWSRVVGELTDALDLEPVREAKPPKIRRADVLARSEVSGPPPSADLPPSVRSHVEKVWQLLGRLAKAEGATDCAVVYDELDAARDTYSDFYDEAEAIARSSVLIERRRRPARKTQQAKKTPPAQPARPAQPSGSALRRRASRLRSSVRGFLASRRRPRPPRNGTSGQA